MNYNELKLAIYEAYDNMTEGYISDEVNKVTSKINALNEWQNDELKKLDDWRNAQEEKLAQQLASNNDFDEYEKCDKQLRDEYFKRRKNITDEWELKMRKLKNSNVKESVDDIKLSIYEAYDNGEITETEKLDLLNSLENSVYESTAAQRNEMKLRDEVNKIEAESNKKIADLRKKIDVLRNLLNNADSVTEEDIIYKKIVKIQSEIKRIDKDKEDKIDSIYDTIDKNYIGDCKDSPASSLREGRRLARLSSNERDYVMNWGREFKNNVRDSKFYSKGKDPNDKKPNKYLDAQKAMKESVNDIKLSIYEAYDDGEITEAEKYTLLESLDD